MIAITKKANTPGTQRKSCDHSHVPNTQHSTMTRLMQACKAYHNKQAPHEKSSHGAPGEDVLSEAQNAKACFYADTRGHHTIADSR